MKRLSQLIPLFLACLPLWAQPAHSDPLAENLFPPDFVMQHAEAVNLTDEQKEFLQTEMHNRHDRFTELHQKLQTEVEAMAALLKKDRVDEAVAVAQFDKVLNQEREIKRAHLALVLSLKNKLTPEQQAKLQEIKKRSAGRAPELPPAIPEKMKKVQAGVKQWQDDGRDPSPVAELMQNFEPLMKQRKFKEAEELLDKALKLLGPEEKEKKSEAGAKKSVAASGKAPEVLKAEIDSLQPPKLVWREIPWRSCLLDGLAEARAQRKPVILWAFINNNPCDERC